MKKVFLGFILLGTLFTIGCSKRETYLAGTSAISAAACGVSFLASREGRNRDRRRKLTHYKYHGDMNNGRCYANVK